MPMLDDLVRMKEQVERLSAKKIELQTRLDMAIAELDKVAGTTDIKKAEELMAQLKTEGEKLKAHAQDLTGELCKLLN